MDAFDPVSRPIRIQYLNFRSEVKTFTGDRASLRPKGRHVSLRVAPSGRRITFARDCIQNPAEVDAALAQYPAPNRSEAQILGYHRKHASTSPKVEALRKKYPGY